MVVVEVFFKIFMDLILFGLILFNVFFDLLIGILFIIIYGLELVLMEF